MEQNVNDAFERMEEIMASFPQTRARLRMLRFEVRHIGEIKQRMSIRDDGSKGEMENIRLIRSSPEDIVRRMNEIEALDYLVSVVGEGIECLPEQYRKTLKALYVHQMTYDNAARALHASRSTIRRWRREALEVLSRIITL